MVDERESTRQGRSFNFNNNIYNNFAPEHSIDYVSPAKRLLPKMDQHRIDVINKLKKTGKLKSLGRSPVPLQLFEETDPRDHLYISTVTKHVPVAHDSQLQSDSSPRTAQKQAMLNSGSFGNSRLASRLDRDSLASP